MTNKIRIISICAGLVLFAAGPVVAQSGGNTESRLRRIENEIQTLSRAIFRGEKPPEGALVIGESPSDQAARANIEVRLSQMEMDLRTLTGRVEEVSFQIGQLQDKLDRKLSDIEMRVAELERDSQNAFPAQKRGVYSGSGQSVPVQPQPSVSTGPAGRYYVDQNVQAPGLPQEQTGNSLGALRGGQQGSSAAVPPVVDASDPDAVYERAFSLIREQNFQEAERAFRDFLNRFPGHALASNAMYWLGETYYVRGEHETAARIFAEGYQKFPDGTKAADNLLKMGMSLAGMGATKDACVALSQLQKEFSDGTASILSRAEQEIERLNCPAQ